MQNIEFVPYRKSSHGLNYKKGDVLVLFGELFQRGYANGLVEEAKQKGMTIIYSTVGRRNELNQLRPLNEAEITEKNLGHSPFINIPLEAGFDLEPSTKGFTPVDLCKEASLKEWNLFTIEKDQIEQSLQNGRKRFKKQVQDYLTELKKIIPENSNILFAHLMAGGVPRSKIILSLMNRVFKGRGERLILSEDFWKSDLGYLTQKSFNEVTAETFNILIDETKNFRQQHKGTVSYSAYGYHGTEIYSSDGQFFWQSYAPYLQGFAKLQLESFAKKYFNEGINVCVYNCPEILTASSAIFPGVEISLYSLLKHLKERNHPLFQQALALLKNEDATESCDLKVEKIIKNYWSHSEIKKQLTQFENWPHHSTALQMDLMLKGSDDLIELHQSDKNLITMLLSELVIKACGQVMILESLKPAHPVQWIGHDQVLNCSTAHDKV